MLISLQPALLRYTVYTTSQKKKCRAHTIVLLLHGAVPRVCKSILNPPTLKMAVFVAPTCQIALSLHKFTVPFCTLKVWGTCQDTSRHVKTCQGFGIPLTFPVWVSTRQIATEAAMVGLREESWYDGCVARFFGLFHMSCRWIDDRQ